MTHSALSQEQTTHLTPATVAWSATETHAYNEPPFPEDAFCIQFTVLSGERHVYRLNRRNLTQLFARISDMLAESSEADAAEARIAA